jgi:methylthioribose-1-phosphate isomerase
VPTTRKRHTVTETERVEEALKPLRVRGARLDFGELVALGAKAKLTQLEVDEEDAERRLELRKQFLETTRKAEAFDLEAALEVREHGWTHE